MMDDLDGSQAAVPLSQQSSRGGSPSTDDEADSHLEREDQQRPAALMSEAGGRVDYDDDRRLQLLRLHADPSTQHTTHTATSGEHTPPASPSGRGQQRLTRGSTRGAGKQQPQQQQAAVTSPSSGLSPHPPTSLTTRRVHASPAPTAAPQPPLAPGISPHPAAAATTVSPLIGTAAAPGQQARVQPRRTKKFGDMARAAAEVQPPPIHSQAPHQISPQLRDDFPPQQSPTPTDAPALAARHASPATDRTDSMLSPTFFHLPPEPSPIDESNTRPMGHAATEVVRQTSRQQQQTPFPAMTSPPLHQQPPSEHTIGFVSQSQHPSGTFVPPAAGPKKISAADMIANPNRLVERSQLLPPPPSPAHPPGRSVVAIPPHPTSSTLQAAPPATAARSTEEEQRAERKRHNKSNKDGKRHKKHKHSHSHDHLASAAAGAPPTAAAPAPSNISSEFAARIKREPNASASAAPSAGVTAARAHFPEGDENLFYVSTDALVKRTSMPVRPAAATRRVYAKQETSLRGGERARQQKPISQVLRSMTEEPQQEELDITAVEEAVPPRAKAELSLSSTHQTPKRQRLSKSLDGPYQGTLGDEDPLDSREDLRSGSGGRGRGSKKHQGAFARELLDALSLHDTHSRRAREEHRDQRASSTAHLQAGVVEDKGALVVRVLMCQQHFGMRLGLVSLATPAISARYSYTDSAALGMLSPLPVLVSETSELARFVARTAKLAQFSSVPPSMLRLVVFPADDHPASGHHSSSASSAAASVNAHPPKLSDFPECFIRLRQPFASFAAERAIPILLGLSMWDRIPSGSDDHHRILRSEATVWREEGEKCREMEAKAKEAERMMRQAEAMGAGARAGGAQQQQPMQLSEHDFMMDVDDVALLGDEAPQQRRQTSADPQKVDGGFTTGGGLLESLSTRKPSAPQVIPFDASLFSAHYSHSHPGDLPEDQFHEVLVQRKENLLEVGRIKQHTETTESLLVGLIQKVKWRGCDLKATAEQLAHNPSSLPPPSFFLQDASGCIVEVQVPTHLAPRWIDVLAVGRGACLAVWGLEQAAIRGRLRMDGENGNAVSTMHRQLLPKVLQSTVGKGAWPVLTVTEDSAFQLTLFSPNHAAALSKLQQPTRDENEIPCLQEVVDTPLVRAAEVSSVSQAYKLGRISFTCKIVHLNNHPRHDWQLYVTDESLRLDGVALEQHSPTPTLIVEVSLSLHRRLLSVFFAIGEAIRLEDVRVEYDPILGVPKLKADEYTEMFRVLLQEQVEKKPMYHVEKAARKQLSPLAPLMIQQHAHTFLHVDDSRSTLHRIATHSSRLPPILTPLQQYHSVFGLVGSIEDALAKPNITERCMACKAIQVDHVPGQRDTKWTNEKAPIVCQHCGSVNEISTQKSECWLHFAQVRVKVDDLDNAGALFQLQLETTELMELFASVTDEKKTKAFRDRAALNNELRGRRLNLTCTLASGSFRPSPIDLRVAQTPPLIFLVTSKPAQLTTDHHLGATQMSQSATGGHAGTHSQPISQLVLDSPPEQIEMRREVRLL